MSGYEHGGRCNSDIRLDFSININPLGIAPGIMQAMKEAIGEADRYPDPSCSRLKAMLAKKEMTETQNIIIGNGASELIMALTHAYRPRRILLAAPGFYGYEHAAMACGAKVAYHYLREDDGFALAEAFTRDITDDTDMIFITNPGNPGGRLIDIKVLDAIYDRTMETGAKLIIDECFLEFTDAKSYDRENVYRLKAFTKYYALPGIRLGYLLCPEGESEKIEAQLPEWNVSVVAQRAGEAALLESDFYKTTCEYIRSQREFMTDSLRNLGIKVFDSDANFILFRTDDDRLKEKLITHGILIRDCSNYHGLGRGYYRAAVRTEKENTELVKALRSIYEL